jgi:hypothetical protein
MFLDGVPGPAFDQIDAPVFADRRWGYLARRGGRAFAIIDGRESVAYDAVSDLIFSRDGHKHAYVARIGATEMVVHHRGRSAFPKVVAGTLAYDARGEHWACIIGDVRTRRFYLAIDGRPRRRFDLGELAAHTTRATSHDAEVLRRWVAADLECTE